MLMKNLEPKALWNYFHQITQIPRPSKKEEKIRTYLKNFAEQQQLYWTEDAVGNLLICKNATTGYENRPAVILQAHMDMVCEKNSDVEHDFETDAIKTYIDDDWIKARGTTLGADNGIGMTMMLTVLAGKNLQHPALECLFTVDEETGLTGALMLEKNILKGSTLINLDSEDDGEIFIGCAGGIGTKAILNYQKEDTPAGLFGCKVNVSGLTGGHSGGDIHLGLGNAIKILNRYLWQLNRQMDFRLISFEGGNLHNAIPREASAFFAVPYAEKETIRVILNHFIADMEGIYKRTDPLMKITLESDSLPATVMIKTDSDRILNALYACPHGVIAMSRDIPELVETSTNLASVKMKENQTIEINTSQRSSVESAKSDIAAQVYAVFALADANIIQSEGYPGWQPNLNSSVLEKASSAYQRLFNEEAKVKAIHAGLECGLFLEKYPHLDMISIGPQMYGVHSPDERLSIRSTQKTWKWLLEILKYC
ncbi:MAG: aminoacyl-histidine dipeptidase [Paludibacter sp.]|nr:aminoacyl-histidine dipeptidase [Paludibacter sp.]